MSNIIDQADCELDIPANYKNKAKRFYSDFLSITVNAIESETANFLNNLKKYVECDPTTKLGIEWSAFKVTTLRPEVTEYMATSTNIRETMIKFFVEAKARIVLPLQAKDSKRLKDLEWRTSGDGISVKDLSSAYSYFESWGKNSRSKTAIETAISAEIEYRLRYKQIWLNPAFVNSQESYKVINTNVAAINFDNKTATIDFTFNLYPIVHLEKLDSAYSNEE